MREQATGAQRRYLERVAVFRDPAEKVARSAFEYESGS